MLLVTNKALQSIGHVRTVSPKLSRFLDQPTICSPLACHALMDELRNGVRARLHTWPRVLSEQTAR
eukprot:4845397-Lingulodinium_polyedra.AAC.1